MRRSFIVPTSANVISVLGLSSPILPSVNGMEAKASCTWLAHSPNSLGCWKVMTAREQMRWAQPTHEWNEWESEKKCDS